MKKSFIGKGFLNLDRAQSESMRINDNSEKFYSLCVSILNFFYNNKKVYNNKIQTLRK